MNWTFHNRLLFSCLLIWSSFESVLYKVLYCINKCDSICSQSKLCQSSVFSNNKCLSSASSEHFWEFPQRKNSTNLTINKQLCVCKQINIFHVSIRTTVTHHFGYLEHDVCPRSSRPGWTQCSRILAGRLFASPRGSDPDRIRTRSPRTLAGVN